MNKEFVPYDIALAMSELGLRLEKNLAYYCEGSFYLLHPYHQEQQPQDAYIEVYAPLYQQAFRWFREKGIYGEPTSDLSDNLEDRVFVYSLYSETGGYFVDRSEEYKSYEEAELACLRKLIEIVNQNKDEYNRNA
jgi:hypothetical protein